MTESKVEDRFWLLNIICFQRVPLDDLLASGGDFLDDDTQFIIHNQFFTTYSLLERSILIKPESHNNLFRFFG